MNRVVFLIVLNYLCLFVLNYNQLFVDHQLSPIIIARSTRSHWQGGSRRSRLDFLWISTELVLSVAIT